LVSAGDKLQSFLRYWTCKEAYIKARGAGLSIALEQLEAFDSGENFNALPEVHEDQREIIRWPTFELTPPFPDYVAALTVEGTLPYRLSCWQWQE
jgi:4'-phosphopantetheinyl transferase